MLFDPFEEQFDAPAQAVELRDGESGQDEIVGQKDQIFSALGIFELDPAQWCVEALARVKDGEHYGLVADQARGFVDFAGVAALDFEIGLGAGNKETASLAQ